jgi:hypothetical protein
MFSIFFEAGYVFADGILTRKKSSKKLSAKLTIHKTENVGYKKNAPIVYVASDGTNFAHGATAEIAILDLQFKTGERNVDEFKNMAKDVKKTPQEWAFIYRQCTGACEEGTRMFMASKKLKDKYTLAEIIKETKGAYGFEKFVEIVGA